MRGCVRTSGSRTSARVEAVDEIERDLGAEARGADAEPRVADGVAHPAASAVPKNAKKRLQVSIAPPQRCVKRMPLELRERLDEVLGEHAERLVALVEVPADAVAPVVDRVVAAVEDAVVGRQPEVVELVAAVGQPLAVGPAERGELRRRERLGHEHVVVDRQHAPAHRAQERRIRARREHDAARPHTAGRAREDDAARPRARSRATGERSQMRTPSSRTARRSP